MKHAFAGAVALACLFASPLAHARVHDLGPVLDDAPQARLRIADLDLATLRGQDRLVDRVLAAARDYCGRHAALVTPAHRRGQPRYCVESMRIQLASAMPPAVNRAWRRGWARRQGRP